MKKILLVFMLVFIIGALTACGNVQNNSTNESAADSITESETEVGVTDNTTYGDKALIVYFSCTGNTSRLANEIAKNVNADVVELIAEQPYSDDDIDYNNAGCRANAEMNDEKARPAIVNSIDNLDDYELVYVGYPIWWGTMPRIMNTFFDTYNFDGKTIMPFCTSGSSGIETSVNAIKELEPNANVRDGLQISSSNVDSCADEVTAWINK